jgi:hypothetical protein
VRVWLSRGGLRWSAPEPAPVGRDGPITTSNLGRGRPGAALLA